MTNLNPLNEHYSKGKPIENGTYIVLMPFVGKVIAMFCDGSWYFENGEQIPDSCIVGWK